MIVRWVCEKCNKKWIYPVKKCIYCKSAVKKQKGTKLEVIGITKVSIPSATHPIVPYNVLLLEDEFGNRMPKKTMKEFNIGDKYIEEKAKTNDSVAIVKVKYDVYEAVKYAIGLLNNVKFNSDDKILIKPSIIAPAYPYQAVNTSPEFLDALLKILLELGVKKENMVVAEQSLVGINVVEAALKSGIIEICKKNQVGFVDISKGPFEEIESDGYKFDVFKEALQRKIINVPIMKTDSEIGISGALENLSRLADAETQKQMHFDDFDKTLPKLMKIFPNILTVADATNGMQGQGPLSGEPAFLNLVLAGKNPAFIDAVFCKVTMLHVPRYVNASEGSIAVEVVGNEIEALKCPIKSPVIKAHPKIKKLLSKVI